MGAAASLFYSNEPDEQTLHRRIRPSEQQQQDQKEYWNDLAVYLKPRLSAESGCNVTSWLQGSYKFGTQIRPAKKGGEFDIDLGVYFEWSGAADDGEWSATDLKDIVQTALAAYAQDEETDAVSVARPKEYCSRVLFSGDFHIDVPAYHEWNDARSLASMSDGFIQSDPVAIYDWWVNEFDDAERDRARRMVRYLKMWAALTFDEAQHKPPSSILLTVLVADACAALDLGEIIGDDELLIALVTEIVDRFDGSHSKEVPNPVNQAENLNRMGDDYDNFREALGSLQEICQRGVGAPDKATAAAIWSEAFQHFFPPPSQDELAKAVTEGRALAKVEPEVEVRVTLPTGKTYVSMNCALNVPRDSKLHFRITNLAAFPQGVLPRWTVRNEGGDAERANDLGHFAGFGRSPREEHAEYNGRHFMDVALEVNGQLYAQRRVPVSILANSIAKNLSKRLFRRTK